MSILVIGSVAYDNIETPTEKREVVLGGGATHFSLAASFFTKVSLVGVVGNDFKDRDVEFLRSRNIDLAGLKVIPNGKTFRWDGRYEWDMNQAHTLDTKLGVFADFNPQLEEHHKNAPFVFLANIDPEIQLNVLRQVRKPKFVAMDTMNFWIEGKRKQLKETISHVDALLINDAELRELASEVNVSKAAHVILSWGPKVVVVKRGEYGALLYTQDSVFAAPAMPLHELAEPTGAGDSFAGGFMGYLAHRMSLAPEDLRHAVICGSVMASYNVEGFGTERVARLKKEEIAHRFSDFKQLAHFEDIALFSS